MPQQCTSNLKRQFSKFDPDVPAQVWKHLAENDEPPSAPAANGTLARLLDRQPPDAVNLRARQIDDGERPAGSRFPDSAWSGPPSMPK